MYIHLGDFLENPHEYICVMGIGNEAFDWLFNNLGEPATVKLFSDIVFKRIELLKTIYLGKALPNTLDIGSHFLKSNNIDRIGDWDSFPQPYELWNTLHRKFPDSLKDNPAVLEILLHRIYHTTR